MHATYTCTSRNFRIIASWHNDNGLDKSCDDYATRRSNKRTGQCHLPYDKSIALIHSWTCKSVSLPFADSRYVCLRVFTSRPVLDFYGCYMGQWKSSKHDSIAKLTIRRPRAPLIRTFLALAHRRQCEASANPPVNRSEIVLRVWLCMHLNWPTARYFYYLECRTSVWVATELIMQTITVCLGHSARTNQLKRFIIRKRSQVTAFSRNFWNNPANWPSSLLICCKKKIKNDIYAWLQPYGCHSAVLRNVCIINCQLHVAIFYDYFFNT